jgi:hypothetical protein
MRPRPIDADALLAEYDRLHEGPPGKARTLIENAPTIEPERKKGEWINGGRIIRCSKCGTGYAAVKGMKSALTYNFCPNCGADMMGERDGKV